MDVKESLEKFFFTLEFYIKSFIATLTVFISLVALGILAFFVVQSAQDNSNSVQPIYDPVQLIEYQACLENRISGTMWYWSKENVLSQCVQYAPTMLAP